MLRRIVAVMAVLAITCMAVDLESTAARAEAEEPDMSGALQSANQLATDGSPQAEAPRLPATGFLAPSRQAPQEEVPILSTAEEETLLTELHSEKHRLKELLRESQRRHYRRAAAAAARPPPADPAEIIPEAEDDFLSSPILAGGGRVSEQLVGAGGLRKEEVVRDEAEVEEALHSPALPLPPQHPQHRPAKPLEIEEVEPAPLSEAAAAAQAQASPAVQRMQAQVASLQATLHQASEAQPSEAPSAAPPEAEIALETGQAGLAPAGAVGSTPPSAYLKAVEEEGPARKEATRAEDTEGDMPPPVAAQPTPEHVSSAKVLPPLAAPGRVASVEEAAEEAVESAGKAGKAAEEAAAATLDPTVLGKAAAVAGEAASDVEDEVTDLGANVTADNSIWMTLGMLALGFSAVVVYCACQQPRDRPWGMPPKRQY